MPTPSPELPRRERADTMRRRNARIAWNARRHRFDRGALVPFLCECSDDRCVELVRVTLDDFERLGDGHFLVAPGHQVDRRSIARVRDGCWLYRR